MKIKVTCRDLETCEVDATMVGEFYAVHRQVIDIKDGQGVLDNGRRTYTVTHVPSGMRGVPSIGTLSKSGAMMYAQAVAAIPEMCCEQPKLTREISAHCFAALESARAAEIKVTPRVSQGVRMVRSALARMAG